MNAKNHNQSEKILSEALELWMRGKTIREILDLFPKSKKELREIFQVIDILNQKKESVRPPKESLISIINQLPEAESVTSPATDRYPYRGEIKKGRPSILQLFSVSNQFMSKKLYVGVGVLALVLLMAGSIYWRSQKLEILPIDYELSLLNQDSDDLEQLSQDISSDNLDQDLANIAGEKIVIETASIENLENQLALELDAFSTDLNDLEGFNNETPMNGFDGELTAITESIE